MGAPVAVARFPARVAQVAFQEADVHSHQEGDLEQDTPTPKPQRASRNLAVAEAEVRNPSKRDPVYPTPRERLGHRAAEAPEVRLWESLVGARCQQDRSRHDARRQDNRAPAGGAHDDRHAIVRAAFQEDLAARITRPAQHDDDLYGLFDTDGRRQDPLKVDACQRQGVGGGFDGDRGVGCHTGQL